ncbi:MAG TPA: hypothetical protein PK323_06850, partial [Bacteroidia bacterium]|nr:hypothetical protein [Bacteroidia bacterium]
MKALKLWNLIEQINLTDTSSKDAVDKPITFKGRHVNNNKFKHDFKIKNNKSVKVLLFWVLCIIKTQSSFGINISSLSGCTVDIQVTIAQNVSNPGCPQGVAIITPNTAENYAWEIIPTFNLSSNAGSSNGFYNQIGELVGTSLMAGDYIIEIETQSGCIGSQTFTISQPLCNIVPPNVTYTNPSVNGAFDGSIDFNFEAGNSCFGNWSYMLKWNGFALNFGDLGEPSSIPGMLNGEVNNLPAGNYELDINPGGLVLYPSACVGSTTFTITEPPCDMNFISTVTQITANSCSNAQISLAITGESRTGLYLVNITSPDNITTSYFATETDGAGSFSIGNLSPGNYFVRVLNNDDPYSSCDFSELLSITEPVCELTLSNFTATNSNSSGCGTGSASISISGNTCFDYYVAEVSLNGNPYSYYYITETDGSGVLSITSLPEGNYTLNVNNGAACTQSQNFTITEPACNLQMNNLVSTNISSTGCNDGTINVDLSGTTCSNYYIINIYHDAMIYGTYYASESSGAGQFNLSTLPVGNYQISVNNGSTSCQIDQTFEITEPACNIAIVNFAANNPTVNVGNNGSITFDAQGAVCNGFYYYEVYQNGNMYVSAYISVTGFSSTAFVNNLPEGNYELKLFSAYMSSCVASQSFTLSASPCNMSISNLTVNNLNSVGCTNGGISCNLSGSTVYGHYYVTLNKDGILFANYFVIPSGAQTAFNLSSLEVGNYEMILSDGYSDPCVATTNFNITQQACNIQINNPVIDQETTSQQTVVASVSGSISGASCDGSYLVNLIQTDGSVFASQTIPTTNPNFLFENVTAGIYSIKAYPGLVSESCIDQYDFILTDPCPVSNVSFVIDSTAGPCTFSTVHVTVSGATDPTKLYSVEYRLDGDSWGIAYGPYFGHPGVQTFDLYLSIDGYYEFRSGPLVVLPTCPVVSGLSIYKKYCDAFQTSTTVTNASNDCSNGVVNIYFNDPIKCLATFYTGKVFQAGVEVENLSFTPIAGNNYVASAQLLPGNYSYIIYTEGDIYGGGIGCPLTGTFSIGNEACNLSISNEVTENTCFGTNYAAQVNGTTCNGSYLVELYKDAMLVSSNTITEYSGIGFLSFSDLQTGSYELKVFSNALNPASCVAINNFDVNTASCNLAINNIIVTNAAADLSFNGSVNFNISGLECSGYQVTILKDGFAYFSNPITASGPVTPVTFTALPPDDYTIVLSNGACEVSTPFTVLQGNPTCNLQVNVTNESKPNSGCSNGSITINMQGNANGNNYSLTITKDGNSIFNANYSSLTAVTDIIPNLSSGNYVITLSYSGSGTCISTVNYNLGDLPCNLAITDVVTTQACDNYNNGAIAFDVNGTICQTSALQLLSNTGAILVNTTISQSEGKVFEDLFAANYSIQVTSPSGCSINYPFTIEPQCDLSLFNESITLEGAGNCTTAKLSYFVNANYCSASLVKLINNTDMTIFYQSNLPNQDGIDANEITNIPVGNYTLQVLNNSGNCSASYNFIIAPAPCSNIQFSNVTLGESSSGCAWAIGYDLNLGNCPGSMMTLAKEGNLVSTYFFNESVSTEINNLSSGNYNLHLTTGSGCVIDYPFAVNPVCNLAISNVITTQSCDASASGTISFNLTGNICLNTPLRLLDNSGLIINSQMIDEAGNYSFIDLIAGTYSIQLVNQAGCSLNYPFTIEPQCDLTLFNESITLEGAGNCTTAKLSYYVNASYCSASIVKLTNNIDMTVVYQSNIPNQDGIDANEITNIPVGNYTLQVLNNSGNCSASYNFIIAPAPCSNIQFSNVTLGESTSGCAWAFGYDLNLGNCPGSIMTLAKEGNLVNTYFFNESVSTEINNLSAGMYNLHLTTGSGCIIDYPFEVSPVCDLAIANVTTTQSCDASASGTISFNLSGNICLNTPLRLLDNTGLIINTQMINEAGNYSFINLIAGNYSIQLVNQAGCSLNYPFTIEPQCDLSLFNES